MDRARTMRVLLLVAASGCLPPDGGERCHEDISSQPRCCTADRHALVSVADLSADPGPFLGRRVEALGMADWYDDPQTAQDCTCSGNVCACIVALGLRSEACATTIRLAGTYAGRPVQCADNGCYPLQLLFNYAVCGVWRWDSTAKAGGEGYLDLEAFCSR